MLEYMLALLTALLSSPEDATKTVCKCLRVPWALCLGYLATVCSRSHGKNTWEYAGSCRKPQQSSSGRYCVLNHVVSRNQEGATCLPFFDGRPDDPGINSGSSYSPHLPHLLTWLCTAGRSQHLGQMGQCSLAPPGETLCPSLGQVC